MNVYRAMITELVAELENWQQADDEFSNAGTIRADANYDLAPRARALLDQHEPEGPSAEDLVEHVRWFADEACMEDSSGDIADSCRELITRWGHRP